jgi:myo-inositol-1-phosphate synthase
VTAKPIKIAIAGVGNCASSLVQGIDYYRQHPAAPGLMHETLAGYCAEDIQVVCAFDVDARKAGVPLSSAIFAAPNNTQRFHTPALVHDPLVLMAPALDGVAPHTASFPESQRVVIAEQAPVDVVQALRASGARVLVNYMPVGSQKATELYADACLQAGVAMVNCVPCFIASDTNWARRFIEKGLPIVGDDIKAQLGATITHRTLARLFADRGVTIDGTYQLNTGGNTDFLNMLERSRLDSKKLSKTQAVQSQLDMPLDPDRIHIGPSDFVPWLKDNKVCFLRIEGRGFGGVPLNMELRLSVEDSPNSAGVVVDAIRAVQIALDRGESGPLRAASAWCMKHPSEQLRDEDAKRQFVEWAQKSPSHPATARP